MTDLSTDEQTVLLIAARGERLIPIGRWKEPVENLVKRGFLVRERHSGDPTGHFNNVISPAGRAAAEELESTFDEILTDVVRQAKSVGHSREHLRGEAERIAAMTVELARMSASIAGAQDIEKHLQEWTLKIAARTLEMLHGS